MNILITSVIALAFFLVCGAVIGLIAMKTVDCFIAAIQSMVLEAPASRW